MLPLRNDRILLALLMTVLLLWFQLSDLWNFRPKYFTVFTNSRIWPCMLIVIRYFDSFPPVGNSLIYTISGDEKLHCPSE